MPSGFTDPVGTIRQRLVRRQKNGRKGKRYPLRFVKVRDTAPRAGQWIPLARWTWEQTVGPVPKGMRVVHLDGNTLNDRPENYGLLTGGQVARLYHQLDPAMSLRNRRNVAMVTCERNELMGRIFRARRFIQHHWYIVDHAAKLIRYQPFKSRLRALRSIGLPCHSNGRYSQASLGALCVVRGKELSAAPFHHYKREGNPSSVHRLEAS